MTTVPASRAPYHDAALDCFRVPLPHGRSALIDASDAEKVGRHLWHTDKPNRHCQRTIRVRNETGQVTLSRFIVGARRGQQVVYLNDDQLDCRRGNLLRVPAGGAVHRNRKVAMVRGKKPSSQYKGVTYYRASRKWCAYIWVDATYYYLGLFPTEIEAARAYDTAAVYCLGALARLNFPPTVTAAPRPQTGACRPAALE